MLTCVCMLRCWMCEVEPMYVDADGEASCCRLVEDFLFFACGGVGVTCIVEYWNVV